MRKRIILLFAAVIIFLNPILEVAAHGTEIEQEIGDYIVVLDFDSYTGIQVGEPVQYNFILLNKDGTDSVPFDNVDVTITPKNIAEDDFNPEILNSNLASLGLPSAGLIFTFASAGEYEMKLIFEENKEALVEAVFPLAVEEKTGERSTRNILGPWVAAFLGLIIGGISGWFLKPKRVS